MIAWRKLPLIIAAILCLNKAGAETLCLVGTCEAGIALQLDSNVLGNSELYVGDFEDGKRTGCGSISKASVSYFGQMINGKKSGHGIEYDTGKMTTKIGLWKNDRFVEAQNSLDRDKLCGSNDLP